MSNRGGVNLYARKPTREKRLVSSRHQARYMIFWVAPHPWTKHCFPTLEEAVAQCERYAQYRPREIQDRMTGEWYDTAGRSLANALGDPGGN